MADDYTLADYRIDLHRIKKMGLNPALARLDTGVYEDVPFEDWPAILACLEHLLDAMTPQERRDPTRIDSGAIQRLSATTGTASKETERAVRHFQLVPDAMRRFTQKSIWERIKLLCR
jgi:signal recognition particle subunit SRP54